jgi:hypothetical protein
MFRRLIHSGRILRAGRMRRSRTKALDEMADEIVNDMFLTKPAKRKPITSPIPPSQMPLVHEAKLASLQTEPVVRPTVTEALTSIEQTKTAEPKEHVEKPNVVEMYDLSHEFDPKAEDTVSYWDYEGQIINADTQEASTEKATPRWLKGEQRAKMRGQVQELEDFTRTGRVSVEEIMKALDREAGFNITVMDVRYGHCNLDHNAITSIIW